MKLSKELKEYEENLEKSGRFYPPPYKATPEHTRIIEKLRMKLGPEGFNIYYGPYKNNIHIDPPGCILGNMMIDNRSEYHICYLNKIDWSEIKLPSNTKLCIGEFLYDPDDHEEGQDIWFLNSLKSRFEIEDHTRIYRYPAH